MKIADYMKLGPMDFKKMDLPELRQAVRVMSDVANKRAKRLSEAQLEGSPALSAAGSPHFGIGGRKTKDELLQEASRAYHFIGSESSTVSGRKAQIKAGTRRFKEMTGEELTPEQQTRFWKAYDRFAKNKPETMRQFGSSQAVVKKFAQAQKEWNRMSPSDKKGQSKYDFIEERMKQLYEEEESEYIDVFDSEDYVEMEYKPAPRNNRSNTKRKNTKKKRR